MLGVGLPPLTVTVAFGAELLRVTVINCDTVLTVKVVPIVWVAASVTLIV